MKFKRTLAAAAIVLGSAVAANAADIPMAPPAPPPPPPPAPVFDWSGPYVGAYTGWLFGPGALQVGAQAGYLWDLGNFVVGLEAQAGIYAFSGFGGEFNANARAGFSFGQALIYGEAGIGLFLPGPLVWTAGGGAEFAINNDMSLFLESKYVGTFGGGALGITVQGGLNWHF